MGMQESSSEKVVIGGVFVVFAVVAFAVVVFATVVFTIVVAVLDGLGGMIVKILSSRVQAPEKSAAVSDSPPARRERTAGTTSDEPVHCMRRAPFELRAGRDDIATHGQPTAAARAQSRRHRRKKRVDVRIPRVCSDGGNECNRRYRRASRPSLEVDPQSTAADST